MDGDVEDHDIYHDLEEISQSVDIQNLRDRLDTSEKKNLQLQNELEEMKQQMEQLLEDKKILETNIVSVYSTAMREMVRKDREISELNATIVSLRK